MPFAAAPLSIVPREAVEHYKERFAEHPVGTGPFRLKTLARRGTSIFERNPNYHLTYPKRRRSGDAERGLLASAGKRLPFFDEVQLQLIEEAQPSILKFLAGELDWVAIDRENFANMAYKDASGFHLKPEYTAKYDLCRTRADTEFFAFNMNNLLVGKNKALRQAIAYGLDAPAYVEKMRNGRGVAPTTSCPPAIAGGQNEVKTPWYPHDLAMAKKKLAEAGSPDGKGLGPNHRREPHFGHLRAAGLRILPCPTRACGHHARSQLPVVHGICAACRCRRTFRSSSKAGAPIIPTPRTSTRCCTVQQQGSGTECGQLR